MKAIFSPGPSYHNPQVRQYAGWWHIMDLYRQGLEELGYDVFIPHVPEELLDRSSTVATEASYDYVAAQQIPADAELFLGPPGYSLCQMIVGRDNNLGFGTGNILYVWNNADWWRDQQLAEEYKRFKAHYDLSPAWRWINKTALEMSDHVIACSPWVKWTHAKVVPEDKISIASWGVDSQRFTPAAKEPPGFRILFVGGDPIRKGLAYLIEAVKDMPDVEVWIAGCAPFGGPDVKVDPRIRQFGMQPNSLMPEIYRECHVMCLPTLEDGIALAVQEAMASGLPVITSPETAEVFEDGKSGLKVGYRNVREIAAVLHTLKEKPDMRQAMGREARALAEQQTWAETKRQFKEIILREMAK